MAIVPPDVSLVPLSSFDTTNTSRHTFSHPFSTHAKNSMFSLLHMFFETSDDFSGAKKISNIDRRIGYNIIRIKECEKMIFWSHFGHYEYLVMPFGLINTPATFVNLMNTICESSPLFSWMIFWCFPKMRGNILKGVQSFEKT